MIRNILWADDFGWSDEVCLVESLIFNIRSGRLQVFAERMAYTSLVPWKPPAAIPPLPSRPRPIGALLLVGQVGV